VPAGLRTEIGLLGHATMLSDPLGVRGALRPFWTLSYEMIFYLVVAGLFVWGRHRHSAVWAVTLAVAGLAGWPDGLLSADRRVLAAGLAVAVAGCVAGFVTGRGVRAAGLVGIGFVFLVAVNGHPTGQSTVASSAQGLLLLAVMFAGTVVYRTEHGGLDRRLAVPSLLLVGLCLTTTVSWPTAVAVAGTFAAVFALRERRMPRTLIRLGTISYSLYVLHLIVLIGCARLVPQLPDRPVQVRLVVGVAALVTALVVAEISYRFVERPAQRLGRRIGTQRAAPGTGRGEMRTRSV
jgi:peptidoglycan/LPS O-acetylase OafA/YrhL